jgi:hypothetical protein
MRRCLMLVVVCGCTPAASPTDGGARDFAMAVVGGVDLATSDFAAAAVVVDLSSKGGDDGGLGALSDTFDGNSLDPSWMVLHPEAVAISLGGSALTLRLTRNALWFNASQGVLVYKMVSGDFKLTSTVHARKASDPTKPPDPPVHLGGVMARGAAGGSENYVFIVAGHDPNGIAIETKNTTNSASQYSGVAWPSGDAQLRLCRVGASFQLLKRPAGGGAWMLAATFNRPDLPGTLQAGLNIYTSANTPDLQVSYDEALFARVTGPADCTTD